MKSCRLEIKLNGLPTLPCSSCDMVNQMDNFLKLEKLIEFEAIKVEDDKLFLLKHFSGCPIDNVVLSARNNW